MFYIFPYIVCILEIFEILNFPKHPHSDYAEQYLEQLVSQSIMHDNNKFITSRYWQVLLKFLGISARCTLFVNNYQNISMYNRNQWRNNECYFDSSDVNRQATELLIDKLISALFEQSRLHFYAKFSPFKLLLFHLLVFTVFSRTMKHRINLEINISMHRDCVTDQFRSIETSYVIRVLLVDFIAHTSQLGVDRAINILFTMQRLSR